MYDLNDIIRLTRDETLLNIDNYVNFCERNHWGIEIIHEFVFVSQNIWYTVRYHLFSRPASELCSSPVGNGIKQLSACLQLSRSLWRNCCKIRIKYQSHDKPNEVACSGLPAFSHLFHEPTTSWECLNPKNICWQCFSTKPADSVNITADICRIMMTSSNGNIFHVTGHLCGEVTGEFPSQRPVTRSFDLFFDLRLSKQWWGWWFETPSRPLWRHCNVIRVTLSLVHW